jgi:protoporphyrinogen oxidase
VTLSADTVRKLGLARTARIGLSYARSTLLPVRPERTLEDFFVNRFGRELYRTFFQDYTEKVWGVPCRSIPADWGAQRVKGLSVTRAVLHAVRRGLGGDRSLGQKGTETSLIERFLYPKYGPGQMWREVRRRVERGGGVVRFGHRVDGLVVRGRRVTAVRAVDGDGARVEIPADWVLSSMPIRDLVAGLSDPPPPGIAEIADGLQYRDFITVGLLLERLRPMDPASQPPPGFVLPDTWIYVQEPSVRLGRIQVFNNWSPYMVRDPRTVWLGLEYFASTGDDLWRRPDAALAELACRELEGIGLIDRAHVLDAAVVRQPKAYPAYFGTYDRFDRLRDHLDGYENLLLIGRNGMHRYNNQDHSMLTAMAAVEGLVAGEPDRERIWRVNTEQDYHEDGEGS